MEVNAHKVLEAGAEHMLERAAIYDSEDTGERSMRKTVAMFNELTGHCVSEEEGWMFMAILKMVRSQQGGYKLDNYEDGAAYFALAAEAGAEDRVGAKDYFAEEA